ncbi:MAG: hypothetical protein WKG01_30120 [Kofleriaceae bacterium]
MHQRISRRHRPFSGLAGLVLFGCMFLPASRGCGEQIVPVDMPMPIWMPYLYGLTFSIIACTRSSLGIAGATLALRVLAWFVTVAGLAMLGTATAVGVLVLVLGLVLAIAIGWERSSEVRVAITGIVVSCVSAAWFAWWAMTPFALAGMWLSLASSLALLAGSVYWLVELAFAQALPHARLLRAR